MGHCIHFEKVTPGLNLINYLVEKNKIRGKRDLSKQNKKMTTFLFCVPIGLVVLGLCTLWDVIPHPSLAEVHFESINIVCQTLKMCLCLPQNS